jgi:exosortase E/protease (VPEID-CTERM system)
MRTASRPQWLRVGLLLALLAAELLSLTARFEVPEFPPPLADLHAVGSGSLFHASKQLWQIVVWIAGSCFLILTPDLKGIAENLRRDSRGYRWLRWLGIHALAFLAFATLTFLIFEKPTDPARLSVVWFGGWLVLASLTLLSWLLAMAPGRSWLRLLRRERTGLLVGSALGVGVWMLIGMLVRQEAPLGQVGLWSALSGATLQVVHALLGLVYSDLVYEPDKLLVGTTPFPVEVSYACSGIEGVMLISVFLAIYLWLFRGRLRFPQVFWLFPLGIATAWLANAARIALLVVIGTSVSPEVALRSFHAQAGWVAFTLIAVGAIALSHRWRFFSLAEPSGAPLAQGRRLAVALLAPLLVLLAISMLTATVTNDFDWFYPLRVVAAGMVLWYFRDAYRGLGWTGSWHAFAIGAAVFVIWMFLEPKASADAVAPLPQADWVAVLWLTFRVLGSTIIVPLAEELAFRGYLMRKLIKGNFESVSLAHFTWLSFAASSILFGLMHGRWLAGTIAGMAYALAVYRRGQLGDAVLAHATTNALIAAWVVTQSNWNLWSRI